MYAKIGPQFKETKLIQMLSPSQALFCKQSLNLIQFCTS